MDRRKFLKFAGIAGAAEAFFGKLHPALAQTWQKLGPATTIEGRARLPSRVEWRKLPTVATGSYFTVALRSDGLVFASGENGSGQLGDNTSGAGTSKSTFVQAIGISNAVAVSAGVGHTVALRSDGLVFACGFNSSSWSGLGDNTIVPKSTFVQSVGISNAVAVACGCAHTVALRSDGLVFACGYNNRGQLGDNTSGAGTNKSTFVQAIGISNAVAIACGYYHTVALRSDGLVFAAGDNTSGRLGDNTTVNKSTFVQAIGISNAVAVACGMQHSIALRSDGLLFTAGNNAYGELGDNTSGFGTAKSTFVQAIGISNAVAIAGGFWHDTIALRSDGLVFACGYNSWGELGDNTVAHKSTFVQALGISNAVAVACGYYHTIALRSDGLVFGCGLNSGGQLGDNTALARKTFVQAVGI